VAAAAGVVLFFAASALLGRLPHFMDDPRNLRLAIVHVLLAAYLPAAIHAVRAGARAELAALRSAFEWERASALGLAVPHERRAQRIGIAAGLAVVAFLVWLGDRGDPEAFALARWPFEVWWQRALEPWLGAAGGLFGATVWLESLRLSRAAALLAPLDLLDHEAYAPFTRQGLRNALWVIGLLSLLAFFLVERGLALVFAVLVAFALAQGVVGLVLPLRGIHRRIVEAKERAIAETERAIRLARDGGPPGRLADLLAWRSAVRDVPEWPFDPPTIARFVLYLALPVGSWLGGALVEHGISRLLE
jgi:hypothetical protein